MSAIPVAYAAVDLDNELHDATILIVDDDAIAAAELCEAIDELGARSLVAPDFEQAARIVAEHPSVRTIVADFFLGGASIGHGNGLMLIEQLRTAHADRNLDCIVVSGDPDVLVDCALAKDIKFLPKPILPESLGAMLADHLGNHAGASTKPATKDWMPGVLTRQSAAIRDLSLRITTERSGDRQTNEHLDRILSAANILRELCAGTGRDEIICIADYIVEQSAQIRGDSRPGAIALPRQQGTCMPGISAI